MRTTIHLPDELHRIIMSLAQHTGRSFTRTVADLLERGLHAPTAGANTTLQEPPAAYRIDPHTHLPVTRGPRLITPEDVARLEDEA
jgi:hypothetical protein